MEDRSERPPKEAMDLPNCASSPPRNRFRKLETPLMMSFQPFQMSTKLSRWVITSERSMLELLK